MSILSGTINRGNPVNRQSPLNRKLVNWWLTLPQSRGGRRWMNLARSNHGALQGTVTWHGPLGRPGGCGSMYLGPSIYISTASTPLSAVTEFTISCWMRQNAVGTSVLLGQQDSATARTGIHNLAGTTYCMIASGTNTYGSVVVNDGLWHHYVMAYIGAGTGDAGRLQLYVDGTAKTLSFGTPIPATTHNTVDTFSIGELGGLYGNGQYDDVAIRHTWFDYPEARQLYNDSRTGYKQTLNWLDVPWDVKHGEADIQDNASFWLTMMS